MKKRLTLTCPQCETRQHLVYWDAQPRATIECKKCGAEAEIRLIKKEGETRFHAVDWYY